ncbi:hypothetical protein QBC39DRAFT_147367 [Podospora conica]|nr:hypothetical protein QBC39DRAFT_147367 [Schizothecium conicum]
MFAFRDLGGAVWLFSFFPAYSHFAFCGVTAQSEVSRLPFLMLPRRGAGPGWMRSVSTPARDRPRRFCCCWSEGKKKSKKEKQKLGNISRTQGKKMTAGAGLSSHESGDETVTVTHSLAFFFTMRRLSQFRAPRLIRGVDRGSAESSLLGEIDKIRSSGPRKLSDRRHRNPSSPCPGRE